MGNNVYGSQEGKVISITSKIDGEGDDSISSDPLDQLLREGLLSSEQDDGPKESESTDSLANELAQNLPAVGGERSTRGILSRELEILEETQQRVNYYLGEILRTF